MGMAVSDRPSPLQRVLAKPTLLVLCSYVGLAVIFFWPGLLPGHTVSAADYLWNTAPWNTAIPSGLPMSGAHPVLVGSNGQLVDGVTLFVPFFQYTSSQLPHIPLWDPYIMGGTPYLADMQSQIFSPFTLPAYILPFWWSWGVIALLKIVVAAMGAYLLGRVMKMGTAGAFLCGVVFGFGLFMVDWIPWPLTSVFPLIPWVLLATERLIRRPGVLWASALAALVALQFFGGHPETSVYVVFAILGYFIARMVQRHGKEIVTAVRRGHSRRGTLFRTTRRPVVALVLALVVGTALAAVTIIPFVELLRHSSDLNVRPRSQVHVPSNDFFAAFLPSYYPGTFKIVTAFYAGALPLMLACIALIRPRVERVVAAVVAALTVAVALGIQPFFYLAGHIPGLAETYLSRLTIIYLLCLALLAGWGLDDMVRGRLHGRRAVVGVCIPIGLLALPFVIVQSTHATSIHFLRQALAVPWFAASTALTTDPHAVAITRLAALIVWLTFAGLAVVLLILRFGGTLKPGLFAALAIALVVADLFQAGMGYNPAIPQSHAVQPVTPAIRFLQQQVPARYVAVTPYGGFNPFPPDVNLRYGLYDLRGYDLPVVSQFGKLWSSYVAPATDLLPLDTPVVPLSIGTNGLSPDALRVLSLYGVRDVLADTRTPPLHITGLHLVYNGYDARIYANDAVLPRTWLVTRQDVVKNAGQALTRVVAPGFDPRRSVLTVQRLPGLAERQTGSTTPGTAHITHYGTEQVSITARARRPAELVLSDTYYPGWKVTVNGRPAQIDPVDYALRGVAVPAGNDRIVFTYDPASFRLGWMISLGAALVVAIALVVVLLRRRRRPSRHARRGRSNTSPDPTPAASTPEGSSRPSSRTVPPVTVRSGAKT